jgi:hypothetical protein
VPELGKMRHHRVDDRRRIRHDDDAQAHAAMLADPPGARYCYFLLFGTTKNVLLPSIFP